MMCVLSSMSADQSSCSQLENEPLPLPCMLHPWRWLCWSSQVLLCGTSHVGDCAQGRSLAFNSTKHPSPYIIKRSILLHFFSVSLKISSPDAELGSKARELAGSMLRHHDGWGRLQHGQRLLAHLALSLSVFRWSHVHQQQFGTVSAPSGSQGLSVVHLHLQHPGQVAALCGEKWHSQISGFLPGWAPFHWHKGTVPLTNIYFKMHLNKPALQSSPWLARVCLPSNKYSGTKAVLTGFFLYVLKDLVPLTNKLLAADGGEKDCDTVWGRVEWIARDGNRDLGEEYTCAIEIEIRLFMEKSYGNPAWM